MPTIRIEGVGTVRIDATPGTPGFDSAVDEIKLGQTQASPSMAVPMAVSHQRPALAASHVPTMNTPPPATAMQVPPIDPLTGRQQMPGRTMTEEETAKYRTAASVLAGGISGGMVGGVAATGVLEGVASVGYPLGRLGSFAISLAGKTIGSYLGGTAGEAYGQMFEWAHGIVPGSSAEAAKRINESDRKSVV